MGKPEIWIFWRDATRARVLRSPESLQAGTARVPMRTIFEAGAEHLPLRDIMADAPGRTFASIGTRRSAMEYHSDPVRDETRKFARSLLANLDTRLTAGEFDRLVICAPLACLARFGRPCLKGLPRSSGSEVAKDFTKLPEIELRDMLSG